MGREWNVIFVFANERVKAFANAYYFFNYHLGLQTVLVF